VCPTLVLDFLTSLAKLAGQQLKDEAGSDSFDMLSSLLAGSKTAHTNLVVQGNGLAIIKGSNGVGFQRLCGG